MVYERVVEIKLTMLDTRLIYIGDRESDIVAMMRLARDMGHPVDWLVRNKTARCSVAASCGRKPQRAKRGEKLNFPWRRGPAKRHVAIAGGSRRVPWKSRMVRAAC